MSNIVFNRRIGVSNLLGESIFRDHRGQRLLWTDMPGHALFVLHDEDKNPQRFELDEDLCSFALITDSDEMLGAFATGLALFTPGQPHRRWLFNLPEDKPLRLNDGRVDRAGRFWVGSLVDREGNQPTADCSGSLFSVERDGRIKRHFDNVGISNGLAFSPDGSVQYFADSTRREIYAFDADPSTGALSNRRVFASTAEGVAPDGATVDADGGLWSAQWGSGEVVRYRPDGHIDIVVKLPVSHVTCVAFTGPDLKQLAVTSARYGLDDEQLRDEPHAGDVFLFDTPFTGLAEPRFNKGADFATS